MKFLLPLLILGLSLVIFADSDAAKKTAADVPGSYILGPNDQITVEILELPEFNNRTYRIDSGGSVSMPLIGRMQAAGLTLTQFEQQLTAKLKTQIRNPHLVTGLVETRSQPVSVMGEVNTPGAQQITGTKTLFDVLATAGGLKPDAGESIKITRTASQGPLPLPNSAQDLNTGDYVATVNAHDVVELQDPKFNIAVKPHDEIAVPKAEVVYVVGDVHKPGGFTLAQKRTLSAVEALSLAEGPLSTASTKHARILRDNGDAARLQIPVNLQKILAGKAPDVQLQPRDVLFVPDNTTKRATEKAAEMALTTISGLIIWRGL